jgi:hypothetical protein
MKNYRDIGHMARQYDGFWEIHGCDIDGGILGFSPGSISPPQNLPSILQDVALVRLVARYLSKSLQKNSQHQEWDKPLSIPDQQCQVFPSRIVFLLIFFFDDRRVGRCHCGA